MLQNIEAKKYSVSGMDIKITQFLAFQFAPRYTISISYENLWFFAHIFMAEDHKVYGRAMRMIPLQSKHV